MKSRYYIAYGSNMSIEQMKYRTPDAQIVGTAMLKGWRLLFRQCATIKKCKGYSVPVLVWKISEQDERNLDCYEGFPHLYLKEELNIAVKSLEGFDIGTLTAMVYIMTTEAVKLGNTSSLPSRQYYSTLCKDYKTFGFDDALLLDALQEAKDFETRHSAKSSR